MRSTRIWQTVILALATAWFIRTVAADAVPRLRGPAPYPPEWQWEYEPKWTIERGGLAAACGAGLALIAVVSGAGFCRRRPRAAMAVVLLAATVLGWGLQLGLLDLERQGAVTALIDRTLDPVANSYYFVAVAPVAQDVRGLLDRHAELLPQLRAAAPHAATHPPGPILYYRGLLAICERWPALTDWLNRIIQNSHVDLHRLKTPLPAAHLATALAGAGLLGMLCAAACWPIAGLARTCGAEPLAAARVGLLWCVLPGPLLMSPTIDQALALPVAAAVALVARIAVRPASRYWDVCRLCAAGLLAGLAVQVSYGAVAFLLLGFAMVAAFGAGDRARMRRVAGAAIGAMCGAVVIVAAPAIAGHDPIKAARTALTIHRELYTLPRSYGLWLPFNLLDLAIFLGLPVALIWAGRTASGVVSVIADRSRGSERNAVVLRATTAGLALRRMHLGLAAGLGILLLWGSVRGEVGRIWIPLMPPVLIAAMLRHATSSGAPASHGGSQDTGGTLGSGSGACPSLGGTILAPEGPGVVATGGVRRRRTEPVVSDTHVSSRPGRGGGTLLPSPAVDSPAPSGAEWTEGAPDHGFRSLSANSTRGYSPPPHPGRAGQASSADCGPRRVVACNDPPELPLTPGLVGSEAGPTDFASGASQVTCGRDSVSQVAGPTPIEAGYLAVLSLVISMALRLSWRLP